MSWLALVLGVMLSCAGAQGPPDTPHGGVEGGGGQGEASCPVDCSDYARAPLCDRATGRCVACLPGASACPAGHRCDRDEMRCVAGCEVDADCQAPLTCDRARHACVGCITDSACMPGTVCSAEGECVPGCSASHPCPEGATCCDGTCRDLESDMLSCGICGRACPALRNAESACVEGACQLHACDSGFADCNGDPVDGCEHDLGASGPCACEPGETRTCYDGPPGTAGIGPCAAGVSTCRSSGLSWGPCLGQVLPAYDACADGIDNDCDGRIDNTPDLDGDGWTACDGDCCDARSDGCPSPALVNPGAFEVEGNDVDDDCDGTVDVTSTCDAALASDSATALAYARAMDLCVTTTSNPPSRAQRTWGVLSASFHLASGTGAPVARQRSIRPRFGDRVTPRRGDRLVVLSTGVAAAPSDTAPSFAPFQGGQDMGTSSAAPADWLDAHGGAFPNAPGCPFPQGGTTVRDSVMLRLRVRVPTNASSFSVSTFFFSAEYPEWVCSPWNDFFLTLLDSRYSPAPGEAPNPADKNLAFYDPPPAGGAVYPLGVNLAFGNTGLFTQCVNGPTGCGSGAVQGSTTTCSGVDLLRGTGFDVSRPPAYEEGEARWCGESQLAGGGTGWLVMNGNVSPGETIELRFVLWDTSDPWNDSVVLLDNFRWGSFVATPGTFE